VEVDCRQIPGDPTSSRNRAHELGRVQRDGDERPLLDFGVHGARGENADARAQRHRFLDGLDVVEVHQQVHFDGVRGLCRGLAVSAHGDRTGRVPSGTPRRPRGPERRASGRVGGNVRILFTTIGATCSPIRSSSEHFLSLENSNGSIGPPWIVRVD
jgi:hypothetical protein